MSSLFKDGCCNNNVAGTQDKKNKCKGCVCELLSDLANTRTRNLCDVGRPQEVFIIPKGESTPLNVNAGVADVPTPFRVVDFTDDCCAVFTYEAVDLEGNVETRTLVLDCRSIAGVICLPQNGNGGATTV